jgi:hypothetical protein
VPNEGEIPATGRCPAWLEELLGPSDTSGSSHSWRVLTEAGMSIEIRCRSLDRESIAFWITDLARPADAAVRVMPCRDDGDAAWIIGRLRLLLMGQPWDEHPPRPPARAR